MFNQNNPFGGAPQGAPQMSNMNLQGLYNAFGGAQQFKQQYEQFAQNLNQNGQMNAQQLIQQKLNSGEMSQQDFEICRNVANMILGKNF